MTGEKSKKVPPKGVTKGGKRFPVYPLKDALAWARKLVSKTHNGPQPSDIIKAGVVETTSTRGDVKISALKQFGLMDGDSAHYSASSLAKALNAAPDEELNSLLEQAALKPEVFKQLYATFHGNDVTQAKLRQRALDLGVHPDKVESCIENYVDSLELAGLVKKDGDAIVHVSEVARTARTAFGDDELEEESGSPDDEQAPEQKRHEVPAPNVRRGVATVQVNIAVDSSLDTEKLQKQLELLRKYGAL